jgi:hypothetical protein
MMHGTSDRANRLDPMGRKDDRGFLSGGLVRQCFELSVLFSVLISIAGYQLVSFIAQPLGIDGRLVSVPLRGLAVILSLIMLVGGIAVGQVRSRLNLLLILAGLFWSLYVIRLFYDEGLTQAITTMKPLEVWLYAIGVCLLSFVGFASITDLELYERSVPWISVSLIMACALIIKARTSLAGLVNLEANPMLNHITAGHTGAFAILIGLYHLFVARDSSRWMMVAAAPVMIAVGGATIILSASRGALVAVAVVSPIFLYRGWKNGYKVRIVVSLGIMIAVAIITIQAAILTGSNPLRYIGTMEAMTTDPARAKFLREAVRLFSEHPLLGSSMTMKNEQVWPHNLVVESFMATGILGGLAFTAFVISLIWKALRLAIFGIEGAWLGLLCLEATIGAMFSGALYISVFFWAFAGVVAGCAIRGARQN